MGLFTSKKKLAAMEEARKLKELEAKITVKRTLNQMKGQLSKFEPYKKSYIDKAREALTVNNKQSYTLAKSGLKILLAKQKFLEAMIMNFELAIETSEMNKIIGSFVGGMNIISDQLKNITSIGDMNKAQLAYEQALANNATQYEALQAFLDTTSSSLENLEVTGSDISDDEIDKLISNVAVDSESKIDSEIDGKLNSIRQKIGNI